MIKHGFYWIIDEEGKKTIAEYSGLWSFIGTPEYCVDFPENCKLLGRVLPSPIPVKN